MARLTAEQVQAEPWKYEASQYQAAMGVHEPWIAEISPMQYAHMSKSSKRQYDAKRSAEWEASTACKREWRAAVIVAYEARRFTLGDACGEAQSALWAELRDREEATRALNIENAARENKITSAGQLAIGDRVFTVLGGWYGRVARKSAKSVRIEVENPPAWMQGRPPMKCSIGELQWLAYNDLKAQVDTAAQA